MAFPILNRSIHSTHQIKAIQGELDDTIILSTVWPDTHQRNSIGYKVVFYNEHRRDGSYIIGGKDELNQFENFVTLKAMSPDKKSAKIVEGIRFNELKKSLVNSNSIFQKHLSKESVFKIKSGHYLEYLYEVSDVLTKLYSDPNPIVSLLTLASLYDYLEKDKDLQSIRDIAVKVLQFGEFMNLRITKVFNEKCRELNLKEEDCPQVDLPLIIATEEESKISMVGDGEEVTEAQIKNLNLSLGNPKSKNEALKQISTNKEIDTTSHISGTNTKGNTQDNKLFNTLNSASNVIIDFNQIGRDEFNKISSVIESYFKTVNVQDEESKMSGIDIIKPLVNELIKELVDHPHLVDLYSPFIQNIYLMDLFFSKKDETNEQIKNLFEITISHLNPSERLKTLNGMSDIKEKIQKISSLKFFLKNKFTQEIFIRNMHLFADIPDFKYSKSYYLNSPSDFFLKDKNPINFMLSVLDYMQMNTMNLKSNKRMQGLNLEVQNIFSDSNDNEHSSLDTYRNFISIYNFFVHNKDINQLFKVFNNKNHEIIKMSFEDINSMSYRNQLDLRTFMEDHKKYSPLYDFFHNRIRRELTSQSNIIHNSIHPHLLLFSDSE